MTAPVRAAWLAVLVAIIGLALTPIGASAVAWPVSTGLLVSEVVTGGASASDEFVEIYNASSADVDLGGLEIVYVTSSGATVTRKQTWSMLLLGAHRHLLIANSAGAHAAGADGTYSGGLSASGGSLVLRTLGGTVIDSLSWGDAASSFVETRSGLAPPAGSSLERKHGAGAGNAIDTNDNLADSFVNSAPVAQPLVAPPVPAAVVTPSPSAAPVTVSGQLTSPTGLIGDGRVAYLDHGSGGLALHLEAANWPILGAGTFVSATGSLGQDHGETTLFLGSAADLVYLADGARPLPLWAATGLATEAFESRLIAVQGVVNGATVDDGTGPLGVIVPSGVVIAADDLATGNTVELVGVLSQVEQTIDGYGRYALVLTNPADVVVLGRPATPIPTTSPAPTLTPTPTPTFTLTPTLTPSPSPSPNTSPTAAPRPIGEARLQPIGATVSVLGVATVDVGRVLGDSVVCIQDESGGICVRLPDGAPLIASGQVVEVHGTLAAPYGNLEVRPGVSGVALVGAGVVPAPRSLTAAELGEATEGLLGQIEVIVDSVEASSSGSVTLLVHDDSGATRVFLHTPLGATSSSFARGQRIAAVGLVGDRLGLYRLWPRDLADITVLADPPTPTPRPTPTTRPSATSVLAPTPTHPQLPASMSIADALRRHGATVTVTGTVTTRPGLLDADATRVTIQDATGAILVRLPTDFDTQPGRRLRVSGVVGTYYGAPQLSASAAIDQGAAQPEAAALRAAPIAPALEWRLVTVTGTIESVHRDGAAWRAELTLSNGSIPVVGLERSGIASTALVAGRRAAITGIVRRAYPTASDQRLAIVPRGTADIALGATQPTDRPTGAAHGPATTPRSTAAGQQHGPAGPTPTLVGGEVTSIDGTTIVLTDASGDVTLELVGDAAPLATTLHVGDLLNVTGMLAANGHLIIADPAALVRVPGLSGSRSSEPTSRVVFSPPAPNGATQPPHMAQIVAFGVIFGLSVALVIGALAVKVYGPNRARDWAKRLKSRCGRI